MISFENNRPKTCQQELSHINELEIEDFATYLSPWLGKDFCCTVVV